ncbi:MAG: hypothetical protein CMM95_02465 [Rickettsiales bacterium]|nr:hypothetical protein [Rickettsiales bacterium]
MAYIVYDFETTGRSARFDQILQAGFIVYDKDFKLLSKLNLRSRINPDLVPSINALRVNRLKVSDVLNEKISSYEMILEIMKFISKYKNSFFVGFNSINFDEEFLRQALWEHFIFPYLTNSNGNNRGDVLNFATMIHAFRESSINVQKNDEGKLTFKLESLAKANYFDSKNAHDAIADVEVTMQLFELLAKKNRDLFSIFIKNSQSKNVEEKIHQTDVFTLHNYMFSSHRIYLVKKLIKHPVYKNQFIGFDLKYDTSQLVDLEEGDLREIYKNKSFFRKIKLNKQPNILDKSYAMSKQPYSNLSKEEIELKCKQLNSKKFLDNLKRILEKESMDLLDNQSQQAKFEEETIYSQNLNYKDSIVMKNFHNQPWDKKWYFAEKFNDQRLRFFAAKHIYRNFPDLMPKKVFVYLHQKISERICSLENANFTTIPAAMEEADSLSLEIEDKESTPDVKEQLQQYNIYINFLNDYYNDQSPKPVIFDSTLSKKLFG